MDTFAHPAVTPLGTPKQAEYLRRLIKTLGHTSPESALSAAGIATPLTRESASLAIEHFKTLLEGKPEPEAADVKRPHLTARKLRQIDEGAGVIVSGLDSDAAWVLQRLAKLREVERAMGTPAIWKGVNAGGPIMVATLVEYFGSYELLASAFGVSVPTVKGWGGQLPANRTFEAQVKTKGHVCA